MYSAQGFHVLGFYSNSFNQGGTQGEIEACTGEYGVTFPQFALNDVIGANTQPVFEWLFAQPNPVPGLALEPTWNFHKYLVSRDGELVGHWVQSDDPGAPGSPIPAAIEAELAQ